ncbi:MAG: Nif3-like dinuclear metal center hexameric protein, partial [Chitinophagaceae bacterium]|nr:Nif3-like dinuclear metal center hexameric protein [Chitinophagaceae bacterium]
MINVQSIIDFLFSYAPLSLQESYDNSGLICGDGQKNCTGIICCLDVTDAVLNEAINAGANLIISHHPLIFKPLRSITPSKNVDRLLIKAIKNDMSIFAIHTNYDNIIGGVNRAFALSLGLKEPTFRILSPLTGRLAKLYTYVPPGHIDSVKNAIFSAGAGKIGLYDECGFQISGTGSFRPLPGSNPFIGKPAGPREEVNEIKLEVIFPVWQKNRVLKALFESHPYEEVAYEIITTENPHQEVGSGLIAEFESPLDPPVFLEKVSTAL